MPRKNTLKMYVDDAYYHVYNRGTDKRNIYEDEEDHRVFLGYLKEYLSPAEGSEPKKVLVNINNKIFQGTPRKRKNYYENIELVAYCLMPNHFHLLIKQTDKE